MNRHDGENDGIYTRTYPCAPSGIVSVQGSLPSEQILLVNIIVLSFPRAITNEIPLVAARRLFSRWKPAISQSLTRRMESVALVGMSKRTPLRSQSYRALRTLACFCIIELRHPRICPSSMNLIYLQIPTLDQTILPTTLLPLTFPAQPVFASAHRACTCRGSQVNEINSRSNDAIPA